MIFPDIDPILLRIGPLAIRWYALAYVAGLVLGWRYMLRITDSARLWSAGPPLRTRRQTDDLLFWVAVGVIAGGRLGYVLFYRPDLLLHPLEALAIWRGGMSFHGGCLGVAVVLVVFAWRQRLNPLTLADVVAPAAPIGLFFGRIANFINGELWGRVSTVPWAVIFPHAGPLPRHPSQLYEAFLEGIVLFCILRALTHHTAALRSHPGLVSGAFLAGYGVLRMAVEMVREPDAHIGLLAGGVTMGMVLSLPMVLAGAALMLHAWHGMWRPGR